MSALAALHHDETGQGLTGQVLVFAPLAAVVAFGVCMVVIAGSS